METSSFSPRLNTNSHLSSSATADSCASLPDSVIARRPQKRIGTARGGFTLVETMMATLILAFVVLSIFSGLILSYRMSAHTRYRDHARYVLKSVGDEFLTRQAENNDGTLKPLFAITTGSTGLGLSWQGVNGADMANPAAGLKVPLGTSTGSLITDAVITREVNYFSAAGASSLTAPASTAGYLLRGKFRISYTFNKVPVEQSLSLVRRVP